MAVTGETATLEADGYDIIGDVHGCAQSLTRLLEQLGYRRLGGVYSHPRRRAIFVGDIVDRGPRIRESLEMVHAMVEAGEAAMVLGNHELNALAYHTPHPEQPGAFLRPHSERNARTIAATLEQFSAYPEEWRAYLDWFKQLPLYLDFHRFRVAHACWDSPAIAERQRRGQPSHLGEAGLLALADAHSPWTRLVRHLTTGVSIDLPPEAAMLTAEGFLRYQFRAKFWVEHAVTYGDIVFQPDPIPAAVAAQPLSPEDRRSLVVYHSHEPILFMGHYWLTGRPAPIAPNIACLDYSAVKFGRLVAYRMDSEVRLDPDKFCWVYVDP